MKASLKICHLGTPNGNQRLYDVETFKNLPALPLPVVFGTNMECCAATTEEFMKHYTKIGEATNFRVEGDFLVADVNLPETSTFGKLTAEEFDKEFCAVPSGMGEMVYDRSYIGERKAGDTTEPCPMPVCVAVDEVSDGGDPPPSMELGEKADEKVEEPAEDSEAPVETANDECQMPAFAKRDEDADAEDGFLGRLEGEPLADKVSSISFTRSRSIPVVREYTMLALTVIDKKNSSFEIMTNESNLA